MRLEICEKVRNDALALSSTMWVQLKGGMSWIKSYRLSPRLAHVEDFVSRHEGIWAMNDVQVLENLSNNHYAAKLPKIRWYEQGLMNAFRNATVHGHGPWPLPL